MAFVTVVDGVHYVDPIVVASQIVLALQTIPSRQVSAIQPVVLSIGKIEGGVRFNIIPDTVRLFGTIRTHDPEVQELYLGGAHG